MTEILVTVPLPPRSCSPNGYKHWRTVSGGKKEYRATVAILARVAASQCAWEAPERVTVSLVFGIKGGRKEGVYQPRDIPNAIDAFKAGFDGLRDAGLFPDDAAKHMQLGVVTINPSEGPYVRVLVQAMRVLA